MPASRDHRGVHEGGGVQAVHRDLGRGKLAGQVEGERGQRELGPAVGVHSVVSGLELGIGGVERDLAERAHVDDPGRRRCGQQRHEQPGQQHRCEIVDGEPQFVAVRAYLPRLARRAEANPRVVDQHIEPRHLRADQGRQLPHVAERGQISDVTPRAAAKLRGKVRHARRIASVGQDLPAGTGQLPGQVAAQPGGGTGDKHGRRGVSHMSSSTVRSASRGPGAPRTHTRRAPVLPIMIAYAPRTESPAGSKAEENR